jgi:hypothetical protein
MSDNPRYADQYITIPELADYGLTPQDVRRLYPWAVEYTALDGSPCWMRADLGEPLADREGEQ